MGQRRRSRAQWRRLVEGWSGSGLTQQRYCDRHGISPGSLQRWRRIFREQRDDDKVGSVAPSAPVQLVPVKLTDTAQACEAPLMLVLNDGLRIEIPRDFDVPSLQRLLGVLQEAP
jgi:transposase-like protein